MIFIKGSHINYIFNNPRKFGVTQQQIKQVYEPNYDDTIDFIKIAIRKGWIRGNYSDQRGGVIELEFKKPGLKAKRALKKLIHDNDFIEAIKAGMTIVHVNTELRIAYKEGIEEGLKSGEIAPYKFLAEGVAEMKKIVRNRLKLFNRL